MRYRHLVLPVVLAAATAVVVLSRASVAGQTGTPVPQTKKPAPSTSYKAPRTAAGQPDLEGVWANNSATPLERLTEFGGRANLTDDEVVRLQKRANDIFSSGADAAFGDDFFKAALADDKTAAADRSTRSFDKVTGNYSAVWLVEREFDRRTSLITDPPDGRIPPMTSQALQRFTANARVLLAGRADGPEDRPLSERCITFGIPDTLAGYNSYYQVVQSPTVIAMMTERIHDTRLIRLDGSPHLPPDVRLWSGDSRGHWDGDTLVVDTTNFSAQSGLRGSDEHLHLVERLTRISPTTINYEFTVEDPTVWTRPWTVMIPLKRSNDQIYEYACHEGNYALPGILGGARAQEKAGKSGTSGSR